MLVIDAQFDMRIEPDLSARSDHETVLPIRSIRHIRSIVDRESIPSKTTPDEEHDTIRGQKSDPACHTITVPRVLLISSAPTNSPA